MVKYLLNDNLNIFKSKRFEDIYEVLVNEKKIFNMAGLFTLSAAIGFRNYSPVPFEEKGKHIHSGPFNESQLAVFYSIILNHSEIGSNIDAFTDEGFITSSIKYVEEYAEGGMQIICDKVLQKKWNGKNLSREYDEYEIDILRYIYEEQNEDAF